MLSFARERMQNSHNRSNSMQRMLAAAKKMPLLAHYHQGQPFDIMTSDVARWLCDQPESRQLIFNFCKSAGVIEFVDGKWVGSTTYAELKR
jgi:hypothetical protein